MNNFNTGDIVLFLWKPGTIWKKGKVVDNNFALCNLPDFCGDPEYYIAEVDKDDNVIDTLKAVAMPKDSKYIIKFERGMEYFINKPAYNIMEANSLKSDKNNWGVEKNYMDKMGELDRIRWKNQFKEVSMKDYMEIPGINELHKKEEEWKQMIEDKLNTIIKKLEAIENTEKPYPTMPWNIPYPYPYPGYPKPIEPWYDINTVTCDASALNARNLYHCERYGMTVSDKININYTTD